ncbi:MAG: 50S ribosomal protein L32e [Promethearchaeia archaeon]
MSNEKERLMKLRKKLKKKRPSFNRVESWRYKRVKDSWRKARGIDSQTRKKTKSGVKSPNVGYRSPKAVRGLHPSGYEEVHVITKKDLEGLDPNTQAITLSGRLGARKRMDLIDYAQKKGFKILNLGISEAELESIEEMLETSIEDIEGFDEFEDEEFGEFEDEEFEDYDFEDFDEEI